MTEPAARWPEEGIDPERSRDQHGRENRERRERYRAAQEAAKERELTARITPFTQMVVRGLTQLAASTWGDGGFTLRAETSRHRRWVHVGIFGAKEVGLEGYLWVAQPLAKESERPDGRGATAEVGYRVYLLLDQRRRPARFGFGDDGAAQARWTWYREQPVWEREHETRDLSADGLRLLLHPYSHRGPDHFSQA
jgi:hypothetical protein